MFILSQLLLKNTKLCIEESITTYSIMIGVIMYASIYSYILLYNSEYLQIFNKFIIFIISIDLLLSVFFHYNSLSNTNNNTFLHNNCVNLFTQSPEYADNIDEFDVQTDSSDVESDVVSQLTEDNIDDYINELDNNVEIEVEVDDVFDAIQDSVQDSVTVQDTLQDTAEMDNLHDEAIEGQLLNQLEGQLGEQLKQELELMNKNISQPKKRGRKPKVALMG